jgi:hypothetical protein
MTKDEFISKHKAVQHNLTHLGFVPWGIVFSIWLAMVGWLLCLIVLMVRYFGTDVLSTILWQIGFCLLVLGGVFVADKLWMRRLRNCGLHCPSCQKWLDEGVADTGCCGHCSERVLDS